MDGLSRCTMTPAVWPRRSSRCWMRMLRFKMPRLPQIAVMIVLAASAAPFAPAAEIANLRNGFSIRAERHESLGDTTRLYTGSGPSGGYIDLPSAQIDGFEPAPRELPSAGPAGTSPSTDLKMLVNSASERTQ